MKSRATRDLRGGSQHVTVGDTSPAVDNRVNARSPRLLALYLPQYHPIPLNDEHWGEGFTEWRLVASARPLFRGHQQPNLPSVQGFYDLRSREAQAKQIELARWAGVEGFVYWHYWFGDGVRLLERPFAQALASKELDFPFALAWANESWSRRWYGDERTVLMPQQYLGRRDDLAHYELVAPALQDERYITVNGGRLFLVYKPQLNPRMQDFIDTWRERGARDGITFYFVGCDAPEECATWGFDAVYTQPALLRPPHSARIAWDRRLIRAGAQRASGHGGPVRIPYQRAVSGFPPLNTTDLPRHLAAMPNWDNTPRKGRNGIVLTGATPDTFKSHLLNVVNKTTVDEAGRPVAFLKSWNEWAEGNYVEPDLRFGMGWLEALRAVSSRP